MELRLDPRPDHLLVHVGGEFDTETARGGVMQMKRMCEEKGFKKILIDARGLTRIVSDAERFTFAAGLAENIPNVRIAVLVEKPQRDHSKTLENTAVLRARVLITTASEQEARRFLEIA
jgi:hypothetical protein